MMPQVRKLLSPIFWSLAVLVSSAPLLAVDSLAERIVLTPQGGMSREDVDIQHWQERARMPNAKAEVFERLAWAYVAKARRTLDAGYYKLAEQTAAAMDARFGPSPESRLVRGHVFHNLHRFAEAEAIARQLTQERGTANDFGLLSDALMEQGKLDEAVLALQQMVNLRPGVEAYGRIAHIRWLKGDLPGAMQAMHQAERASNSRDAETYAWILVRLSGYALQSGLTSQALALADTANKTAENYAPALLARGKVLLALNRKADAVTALRAATQLNPLPEYQWWLADALRSAGEEAEASKVEADLKSHGQSGDPRTLALFLATRSQSADKALALAREELGTRQDVLTKDAMAWALAASGDLTQAAQTMQAALAEKTQDARLFLHAGEIALRRGERGAAEQYFQQAQAFAATLTPSERSLLTQKLAGAAQAGG